MVRTELRSHFIEGPGSGEPGPVQLRHPAYPPAPALIKVHFSSDYEDIMVVALTRNYRHIHCRCHSYFSVSIGFFIAARSA
jgi:hypothetical protein